MTTTEHNAHCDTLDTFDALDALRQADGVMMNLANRGEISDEGQLIARIAIKRRYLHRFASIFPNEHHSQVELVRQLTDMEIALAEVRKAQVDLEDRLSEINECADTFRSVCGRALLSHESPDAS